MHGLAWAYPSALCGAAGFDLLDFFRLFGKKNRTSCVLPGVGALSVGFEPSSLLVAGSGGLVPAALHLAARVLTPSLPSPAAAHRVSFGASIVAVCVCVLRIAPEPYSVIQC